MSLRVLWAEDQVQVIDALAPLLEGLGAEICGCVDADEAYRLLQSEQWNVVIVDLQMPPGRWGGLDLLRRLGTPRLKRTPTVVLSGAGTLNECIEAMRLGVRDYVQKERAREELVPAIEKALSSGVAPPSSDYEAVAATERQLHGIILGALRRVGAARGDIDVFRSLVPAPIAVKCYQRMLESGTGSQEDYLDLVDLRELLDRHWNSVEEFKMLERVIRPKTKDDRSKWIAELNEARKVVAHPIRGALEEKHRSAIRRAGDIVAAWSLELQRSTA